MFSTHYFDKHIRLMTRMADTLGVDLETEIMSGRLSPESYRSRVFACVGCQNAGDCAAFLDASGGTAEAAPDYCRNKSVLDSQR
ncbi:DUF6455 family protein [Ovoidimarina sediminis]|uniref:DUF6455 family protein n=1 Tax=Ovoidimarina sediminis TaxID=3079856 RepID=UPI002913BA84|nr:DUF6455 family protein [Rhodophyticola sp. MJ-SS7]MDU8943017.1 DUF6455 family protein [Rhodophyticola sp. MJ-SS7]